ncbi:hypothetical protein [Burkholderia seminalis]|uniref:hypothetical protein n=1 Tax=Burkholderia seminalis TaxID=488731 RepID=UPI0014546538|nr:hypothetical protein [Burkholderia seminalis]MCA8435481.1 hypothetical protein [Burkholderia seminalis]VWC42904.1 hypothetical protein BSE24067_07162 [Burkholderia seminalis]
MSTDEKMIGFMQLTEVTEVTIRQCLAAAVGVDDVASKLVHVDFARGRRCSGTGSRLVSQARIETLVFISRKRVND